MYRSAPRYASRAAQAHFTTSPTLAASASNQSTTLPTTPHHTFAPTHRNTHALRAHLESRRAREREAHAAVEYQAAMVHQKNSRNRDAVATLKRAVDKQHREATWKLARVYNQVHRLPV